MKKIDRTGHRYGRLTVLRFSHRLPSNYGAYWVCKCDCGTELVVCGGSLTSANTKSCGCFRREHSAKKSRIHGHVSGGKWSATYNSWAMMVARCTNPKNNRYYRYGGRGIKVCEQWLHSFSTFLKDMGERPAGKFIERVDNDVGYCPENCKWATRKEQGQNKSNNRILTFNGLTMNLTAWSERVGINGGTLWARIHQHGWSVERALTEPLWNRPK